MSIEELKSKIKLLQDYLGPNVGFTSDKWPNNQINRWLMEYLSILKLEYYKRLKRNKKSKKNKKFKS